MPDQPTKEYLIRGGRTYNRTDLEAVLIESATTQYSSHWSGDYRTDLRVEAQAEHVGESLARLLAKLVEKGVLADAEAFEVLCEPVEVKRA